MRVLDTAVLEIFDCEPDQTALVEARVDAIPVDGIHRIEHFNIRERRPDLAEPLGRIGAAPNCVADGCAIAHVHDVEGKSDVQHNAEHERENDARTEEHGEEGDDANDSHRSVRQEAVAQDGSYRQQRHRREGHDELCAAFCKPCVPKQQAKPNDSKLSQPNGNRRDGR